MRIIIVLFLLFFSNILQSQNINMLDFETYDKHTEKKPMIIYINTDWCSVCKIQKPQINEDKNLVKTLNNHFDFINFNAEKYTKDIRIFGKTFEYYPNGNSGLHELAYFLTDGSNAYPAWIFLDKKGNVIKKIFGLISNEDLHILLADIRTLNKIQ